MRPGIPIALCFILLTGCGTQEQYCFRDHLDEAIELNEERRDQYAALVAARSDDEALRRQSERVSDMLISGEKKAVMASRLPTWFWSGVNFDRAARRYQAVGIPLVCEDFEPMRNTPAITPGAPPFPDPDIRVAPRREYDFSAARYSEFELISRELASAIDALSSEPRFDCLHRHILESALRISNHAPMYIEMAEIKGMRSPEDLLRRMIDSHFWRMEEVIEIDDAAIPLQALGIPIVCSDVPPIPHLSDDLVAIYQATINAEE